MKRVLAVGERLNAPTWRPARRYPAGGKSEETNRWSTRGT